MGTRSYILKLAARGRPFKTAQVCRALRISRQTVSDHLQKLVEEGYLDKSGSTRGAIYLASSKRARPKSTKTVVLHKKVKGLEEDRVFQQVDAKLSLRARLPANTYSILSYAFTEMLNNAIDHSGSEKVKIKVRLDRKQSYFEVRDWGVGVFRNVQNGFSLKDEYEALEHVFKGKQTTQPDRHSGEGIFFTSRIADEFVLRSHKLVARMNNRIPDVFLREDRNLKGTYVQFAVQNRSSKTLKRLFGNYTGDEYDFNRNIVRVRLSEFEGYLSRSQAKRLVSGLEKFASITFDFKGVREIGQGFADEIFRVFAARHPQLKLHHIHAVPAVQFMIRRATAR